MQTRWIACIRKLIMSWTYSRTDTARAPRSISKYCHPHFSTTACCFILIDEVTHLAMQRMSPSIISRPILLAEISEAPFQRSWSQLSGPWTNYPLSPIHPAWQCQHHPHSPFVHLSDHLLVPFLHTSQSDIDFAAIAEALSLSTPPSADTNPQT
jgi:hypothetical protein